ncbi:MAG: hypothetical protein FWF84_07040 [Kiritimatiellaeota bacterium]|nr:hypothetical protein [Kiritimatiellota bacterium]
MATELQSLIDKIHVEGIDKAKAEAEKIVAEAQAKAKAIVAEAETNAASARQKSEAEATLFQERAQNAIRQAARDVLLGVERDINETLGRLFLATVSEAMTPDVLQKLIVSVVASYASTKEETTVSLPPAQAEALKATLLAALQKNAASGIRIAPDADVRAGFRVSLSGGRIEHDFTAQAVQAALMRLLRPKLAALIQKES